MQAARAEEGPRKKKTRSDCEPKKLVELDLALDNDVPLDALITRRQQFFNEVSRLRMDIISRDNPHETVSFVEEDVMKITNFLFTDVMGAVAYNRAADIVNFYCTRQHDENKLVESRGAEITDQANCPAALRKFCSSFIELKKQEVVNSNYADFVKQTMSIEV